MFISSIYIIKNSTFDNFVIIKFRNDIVGDNMLDISKFIYVVQQNNISIIPKDIINGKNGRITILLTIENKFI